MISLTSNHLRCCIAGTTTGSFEHLAFLVHVGQAEINNFDIVLIIKEQVLWFQITMTDLDLMYVLNSRNNLLGESASLLFSKSLSLDDVVEQFSTTGVLHYQEELT